MAQGTCSAEILQKESRGWEAPAWLHTEDAEQALIPL